VADDLGSAELRITIDDGAARKQLENLKKAIEGFNPKFKGVERELAAIATQADAAKVRVQSLNQVLNQAPGASYSKISAQIQRLARESRDLQIQSEQYVKTLQRISELEFVRNSRAGRQRARADFEAAQGSVLTRGFGAPDRLPTLPPTIAGDLQRIRELTFLLRNLDVNSAEFGVTQRQLAEAQRRVADATEGTSEAFRRQQLAQDGVIRRAEKLRQVQEYYGGLNPRAGGIRDPESGAMIARGAGAAADERAYRSALRASQDLLETDLKRLQVVRQLAQQLTKTTAAREVSQREGFAAFSAAAGDPALQAVNKSVARNAQRRAQLEERRTAQLDALDADLARIREQRNTAERRALQIGGTPQRRGLIQGGAQRLLGEPLPVPALPSGYFPGLQRRQRQEQEAALRRRQDITSNALIGGAFPLLFGQGIGASVGGAVGGGAGGAIGGQFGFGLSLVGTAVGAQFDAIIQKAGLLGQALGDPIKNFEALRQSALLSSRGLERQVQFLISSGREAEAAAIIQQDLARSYGSAENARELAGAQDKLNRSWAQLSAGLAVLGLEPIANAAQDAANALGGLREIIEFFAKFRPPGLSNDAAGPLRPFFSPASPGFGASAIGAVLAAIGGGITPRGSSRATAAEDAQVTKTAAIQKEIEATQARRLALQKQLAGVTGDENTATAQAAKAQDAILGIREAQLQAASKLAALPASASFDEFNAAIREAKENIEKARIEFEKLVAAQNNAARLAKRETDVRERTTGLAPSARREAELAAALTRTRTEYDKAQAATEAAVGDDAKRAAQAVENNLGQAWRSARQDLADYNAELAFTLQRQEQVNALALAATRERISSTQALIRGTSGTGSDVAGQVIDIQRGALEQRLGVRSRISEARRAQFDIGQQLNTARERGDIPEFRRLLGEQETAAQNTRLALIEGADAITQSSRSLVTNAKAAVLSLTETRSDPQGLNRFLDPGAIQNRAQADFSLLLPQFREAQGRFRALTGANAPEFTGPTSGVNAAIRDFINSVNKEFGATETLQQTQRALADNTSELSRINTALVTQVSRLADKDWTVLVNGVPTTLPAQQQAANNGAL
jgi:hypothetical protein